MTTNTKEKLTDLNYLQSISENDQSFMKEMIVTFLEQTPIFLQELELLVEAKDWKKAGQTAHRMKPSFTFMGMPETQLLAKDIEKACEEKANLDQIPEMLQQIKADCEMAYQELDQFLIG